MKITQFDMSLQEMEDFADFIKTLIVSALVKDDLIDYDIADEWCANHTVMARDKTIFRTISRRWEEFEVDNRAKYYQVVKRKSDQTNGGEHEQDKQN